MDLKALVGLRPRTQTEVISAAVAKAMEVLADRKAAVAQLEADRPNLLLNGSASEVEKGEVALVEARSGAERASVVVTALGEQLRAAEKRDRDAQTNAAIMEADELLNRFEKWVATENIAAAEKISSGLAIEMRARDALERARGPPELQHGVLFQQEEPRAAERHRRPGAAALALL
ncbi:hypothetical protein EOD42_04135 [Rhodovarius crocodyli]|uniref:Uncharacterized protein n=1 Tax=Rhodovarius crocodyli TaxID=1979269 RepID=A0A437MNS3_9PROT|nr:hypothetical protein [Rhodovarius crocodyli]RVT99293.1 hypothetical protein EOD42_04135 [Rhodovarius crocodyli]